MGENQYGSEEIKEEAETKLKQPSASNQRISTAHSADTGMSCAQKEGEKFPPT